MGMIQAGPTFKASAVEGSAMSISAVEAETSAACASSSGISKLVVRSRLKGAASPAACTLSGAAAGSSPEPRDSRPL